MEFKPGRNKTRCLSQEQKATTPASIGFIAFLSLSVFL